MNGRVAWCPSVAVNDIEQTLREQLRGEPIDVPEAIDRAILHGAAQCRARRRVRRRLRLVGSVVASSAAASALFYPGLRPVPQRRTHDMIDAYRLALTIERGAEVDLEWDLDRNGRVDERDVSLAATFPVALAVPDSMEQSSSSGEDS